MRFIHFLALLGFAIMAASFSLPGAYERLWYYYSYKLDNMAGRSNIASGCSKSSGVCSFDDFVHFIEGRKASEAVVQITKEEFPPVEETALRLQQLGKTGSIQTERVIGKTYSYPELFRKLGTNLDSLLPEDVKVSHPKLEGSGLEQTVKYIRENIILSMKRVLDGRVRATLDFFRPYGNFKVVPADGDKAIDFDAMVKANEGGITREKLEELWTEHVRNRPVTEEIVKDFKPLADYQPTIRDREGVRESCDLPV